MVLSYFSLSKFCSHFKQLGLSKIKQINPVLNMAVFGSSSRGGRSKSILKGVITPAAEDTYLSAVDRKKKTIMVTLHRNVVRYDEMFRIKPSSHFDQLLRGTSSLSLSPMTSNSSLLLSETSVI